MSEELKPCPFCKSSNIESVVDDGAHWMRCKSCGATGPLLTKRSEDDEPDWNSRPRVAELEMQNAMLKKGMDLVNAELAEAVEMLKEAKGEDEERYILSQQWHDAARALLARHGDKT